LGTAYGELEKDDLALPNYEKALALNAGLTELYSPIGIAYYEKGDFAKSDEYLSKAMAARPQDAETKYFLALVRYKQGRNDEAISALKQSIAIKDTPEAHYYLGEVYDAVNREADAISEYKRAIALNPAYKEAWFDLGAATYNRGKYNEAVEAYSQALKLDNQNAEARANLADVYRQLKQYAKAESEYNLATLTYERMPKEKVDRQELAELYSRHGFVLGRLAKWNSAIVALEKALAISPDKVDYTNIGWAYLSSAMVDRGNKKEAEAKVKLQKGADNLNKAVALDPNFIGALLNLGVTYKELGNYSGAIQALAKCVDLRKNWLVAHNELGLSYFYSNDYEKASGQFKKVTEIDKNFADGYFNLAVAEFKRGDLKAARKAQDKLKDMKYLELAKRLEYVFSGASITGAGGDIKKN
jgi:tetratricopeptide (TPR) repeat protein